MINNGSADWGVERWRLALTLFGGFVGGLLSGFWLISFILVLLAYIGWLLFKLQQLHHWLEQGGKPSSVPDSNGTWERITYHIQNTQKISDKRKKNTSKILRRFQGIITSLPYATVILTANNEIDWANKESTRLLRIKLKTDRGQRLENLIRLPKIHKLLTTNQQKEIEIKSPFDDRIKLAIQLIPVQGDLKLLIARDISQRVELQEMRKNFIANASHELRTPLTVIAGYLEIMQGDRELPEQLLPAVESATEQSTRMQRIIEDLLTLSRLESSEINADKAENLTMAEIIHSICSNEALVDENAHTLTTQLDETLHIRGIKLEIISVCTNLIRNAIRYTPAHSEIIISWQKNQAGEAVLSVEDKGEGIPAEHLSHLTERFYRIDKGRSREKGGTGLGLAIVQHIVQRHGAQLDIQSEIGKGSVFKVTF